MAFGGRNNLERYIAKGSFFEAFIVYMGNEDACEEDIQKLKEGRDSAAVDDFLRYTNLWNEFRELVLLGDYEKAKAIVTDSEYGNEMGILETKSVLNDLAEKTGDIHCYEAYWDICGMDTVSEHEYALSMLTDVLGICPDRKKYALEHLWWLIDNSEKKKKLKYAEQGLTYFLKPNTFIPSMDAARLIEVARKINPKSKEAVKTEYTLYERDRQAIAKIRPAIQNGDYESAIESLRDSCADTDEIRRTLIRGAYENKADAVAFVNALKRIYKESKDPFDAFAVCTAIWNCDLREDEKELNESMQLALSVLSEMPNRERYTVVLLDALYLTEPYPLPDETAIELAEAVLKTDSENEIALECIAIAKEQAGKNQ